MIPFASVKPEAAFACAVLLLAGCAHRGSSGADIESQVLVPAATAEKEQAIPQPTVSHAESEVAESFGVVTAVHGRVQFKAEESASWQQVELGQAISVGAKLRTGIRSLVELEHNDETLVFYKMGQFHFPEGANGTAADGSAPKIFVDYGTVTTLNDDGTTSPLDSTMIRFPDATLSVTGHQTFYMPSPLKPDADRTSPPPSAAQEDDQ